MANFRRHLARCKAKHPIFHRYRLLLVLLLALLFTLVILHLVVLPAVSGAYNDSCYLPMEKLASLRYAVQKISQMMEQCNKTYWLDYGKVFQGQYINIFPYILSPITLNGGHSNFYFNHPPTPTLSTRLAATYPFRKKDQIGEKISPPPQKSICFLLLALKNYI